MSQLTGRRAGSSRIVSLLRAAPLVVIVAAATPALAQREDEGLQLNCANDYFRLCAGVDPNSPEADRCMIRNKPRLSPECKASISDYDRRSGTKNGQRQ